MTLRLRPAVRTTVVLAAAALLTTACSGHLAARSDSSPSSASSSNASSSAVIPVTPAPTTQSRSTSTSASTAAVSTTPISDRTDPSSPAADEDGPKARAAEAFHHWTSQVPVYPGAVPWEAGAGSPALGTPQVEGYFTLTTSWTTADTVPTVVSWFHRRVQVMGYQGSEDGPVAQWSIPFDPTTADRAAVTAASLSLLIRTGGRGTLVTVVAAGAPIPDRSGDTRIDPDLIVSATVRITPSTSPMPEGWEPRRPTTVTLSPTGRNKLIALLDGLPVQPPMLSGGVLNGYYFVVTLRSADGSVITVSSDTNHSIQGPVLDFGDGRHVQLDTGRSDYPLVLSKLCGVVQHWSR